MGRECLTHSIFQTILQRCWVILKTTEKLPQAPPMEAFVTAALWFQLELRVSKCVKPHVALAYPASLPLTPGGTMMAAGCALKHLQSYHIANTRVVSKCSVTPPCHCTELSSLLRFCCKSYSSAPAKCLWQAIGKSVKIWAVCLSVAFAGRWFNCSTIRRVPGRLNYPSSSPGC